MRGIVECVWEAIEKIDLEGMQEDIDEEAMVVMAKLSEVWLLKAMVRRSRGQLEESDGEGRGLKGGFRRE